MRLIALALILLASAAHAAPFSNQGFETGSLYQWVLGADENGRTLEGAPEGRFMAAIFADIPLPDEGFSSTGLGQEFDPLTAPITMVVRFETTEDLGPSDFFATFRVLLNDTDILMLLDTRTDTIPTGFTTITLPIGTTGVHFQVFHEQRGREDDFRSSAAFIDLAPERVPLPPGWGLLGAGLAWLGWRRLRPSHSRSSSRSPQHGQSPRI